MNIGENIKKYRKQKKMTQPELAAMIGKSESSIRKYENGSVTPDIETIQNIANSLNTDIYSLTGIVPLPTESIAAIKNKIESYKDIPKEIKNNLFYLLDGKKFSIEYTQDLVSYEDALDAIIILSLYCKPDCRLQLSDYKYILNKTVDYMDFCINKLNKEKKLDEIKLKNKEGEPNR